MSDMDELNRELGAIEDAIAAVKARLPAHSAKPGMMTELIDLEDQRGKILEQIAVAEKKDREDR